MFTALNYQYTTALSFITTDHYSGGGANIYSRWYKNGVLLTEPADYSTAFSQYGVNSINNLSPLNTGDIIRLELYDSIQNYLTPGINNGNGTMYEFDESIVLPRYSYLEMYAPNPNGITSLDTTDQSVIQLTPLTISKCSTTPINAHALSVISIGNNRLFDTGSYTYGQFQLNGVDFTNADVTQQNLQMGTFNFSGGIWSHNAENIALVKLTSLSSNILTYQHNGINTADDFSISINGVGFSKISSDGQLNRYAFLGDDVNLFPQFATATSLYSIEETPTSYILKVDGVAVKTVVRSVVYSSTIGAVSNTGSLSLGTSVNYIANTAGTGYIQALIDGTILARQQINVVDTPAPVFTSGSYSSTCPASTFDLNTINEANPQAGYTLKWYSDSALTSEITNLVLNSSQTVYGSFESDTLASCNKIGSTVTITINNCAVAVDDNKVTSMNTAIAFNILSNDTTC